MTFPGELNERAERPRDDTMLWLLVSSHLGLSTVMSALYGTWFALLILSTHVVLCACWALALRKRTRLAAGLERRVQRAEEAALAKSVLLSTLSHEMRSPLNGMLGMSSLLSRTSLDARQREQLATLRTCADTLLVMVNDVLDFARLEAGKFPIEVTPFELRAAVDEVLALNGPRAQDKGIELFAVVERTVPEEVVGDLARVRQALTNLVSNAVKFTATGEVEVRVSVPRTGWLRFAVSDTGIGVEPAARARLFQPFSQADGGITKDYGGSGLGLAISRRLVRAMGGTIDFESTLGIGSRFFFELPLGRRASTPSVLLAGGPARFDAKRAPAKAKRVVIVVPHLGTREGLIETCASLGIEAECAEDLSHVEHPFDVAIVDSGVGMERLEAIASFCARADAPASTPSGRARISVIARSTVELPSWVRSSLSWPVRQTGVIGAMRVMLRAGDPQRAETWQSVQAGASQREPHFAEQTRVLLVEDTPVNQVVARALLSELGITVRIARDGQEALDLLRAEPFQLILMDCRLPKLNGFETTRRLRTSEGPNRETPVIALTASTSEGDEAACREAGMDDYLAKPIARNDLIRKLERWLPLSFCSRAAPPASTTRESHADPLAILLAGEAARFDVLLAGGTTPVDSSFFSQTNARTLTPPDNDVQAPATASNDLMELEDFMHDFEAQVGTTAVLLLAASFRDSAPEKAAELSHAVSALGGPDRILLAERAHSLRGAVQSMGLKTLAARLDQLERASTGVEAGGSAREQNADVGFLQSLTAEVEMRVLAVSDALASGDYVAQDHELLDTHGSASERNEAVG